jgi:hypothetical protein
MITEVREASVRRQIANAESMLPSLGVARSCVIFTIIPFQGTPLADAEAIASATGVSLIVPQVDGLRTVDGSHLDAASSRRWSEEFLRLADSAMKSCIEGSASRR